MNSSQNAAVSEHSEDSLRFDVRQNVRTQNITRFVIAPLCSSGLILFGLWLIPSGAVFQLTFEAIETWSFWGVIGAFCIAVGTFGLLKEAIFALRASGTAWEWHFVLSEDALLWHVPNHAHGHEEGFEAQLDELKEIECRTVLKEDAPDQDEYWVHFHARDPVKLQRFSGISLSSLVDKITAAGVPRRETQERY